MKSFLDLLTKTHKMHIHLSMSSKTLDMAKCVGMGSVCACFNIRKAARVVTQLYDEALRSQDLRGTQFTLLVVVRNRGPVTVKQLAETTVTDRTTLTRNLRPLEKKRLIRIEAGKDRRERIVTLTDRGDRTLANALPLWDRAQAQITSGLGQERLRRLLADLSAVVAVTQRG